MNSVWENCRGVTNSKNYKSTNKFAFDFVERKRNEIEIQTKTFDEKNSSVKVQHKKNKSKNIAKLLTSFVAIVSGAAVVTGTAETLFSPTKQVNAQIESVYTTESDIYYYIFFDDEVDYDNLYIVLYNDFTNRSQKVEEQMAEGVFDHLQENMKYTLAVKQGSKVIVSKEVRTINQDKDYQNSDEINERDSW